MKGLEYLESAKTGEIVPLYEELSLGVDAEEYFKKISDYGRKPNCILLESADIVTKYGEKSIGSAEPCLKVTGRQNKFEITALNHVGKKFLHAIRQDLEFCGSLKTGDAKISGTLEPEKGFSSESERLLAKTHADILRAIAFKLKPTHKPITVYGGLMGIIAYDFIDQFEELPENRKDELQEPDYELNFYDNLFMIDHPNKKLFLVANALVFNEENREEERKRCEEIIERYKAALGFEVPHRRKTKKTYSAGTTDTPRHEFISMVRKMKKHVQAGDVFQIVPSRTISVGYSCEEFDIYAALRRLNPSPYMFFFRNSVDVLAGSSPETFLRVYGDGEKTVEIRPIAGTKPRGFNVKGGIDTDLDSRFEAELKNDKKELAEHTMLIDLARNDVARVSKAGTRVCESPYAVEKYSHVQHLVSRVKGTLKPELDALHAYLASMNMGTLTGAPKVEAMRLLRIHEKNRRGFYGGSIGYLTPSGEFDSAIIIRSMSLKSGKAFVRAGAGIVFDSVPEAEFEETERKAMAALRAIQLAEGGDE